MKITRGITHHVNMGNFEWVEVSSTLEIETSIDSAEDDFVELEKLLKQSIEKELKETSFLTASPDSYVHELVEGYNA